MTNFIHPPKLLLRKVAHAITDFTMINNADRILVAVSGGKDSLTLLHILGYLQVHTKLRFTFGVITIDPQVHGFDPYLLQDYYKNLGVTWHYRTEAIMSRAKSHMRGDSFCAYCARMKRGLMYATCREQGYNVLALAQHLDDLAESLLMSLFHGGQFRTMKASYRNDAGDLQIIRSLVYCRERQTQAFAATARLPVIPDNCPACFKTPTERLRMKQLLAQEEQYNPHLFPSLLHAIRPLLRQTQ